MDVAVSGASGLIGTALVTELESHGHRVRRLVRRPPAGRGEVRWDPVRGEIDTAALQGVDAAVHLAGESIGAKLRWNADHKRHILRSRTDGTTLLAGALAGLDPRPAVLVSGSAVGWYGDRGDETLTEDSPSPAGTAADGFLADVCRQWEAATAPAAAAGIRVVHVRTGIVLDRREGVFPRLLLPARLGLGARFGGGRQYMSWITLADEVAAIRHVLETPGIVGPVNLTAPHPVTNSELVRALGRVLHRPAVLTVPAFAVRAGLGEAGRELLLSGQRVLPQRLTESGFAFAHPDLEPAMRAVLDRD
ncbi:MAG TPA: TIGR01777 family oxidoreductase [Acidimicrobiales bacterium]|nr:TIGR01777 family oxidoreductase [Acidimicrobiales bacterium]